MACMPSSLPARRWVFVMRIPVAGPRRRWTSLRPSALSPQRSTRDRSRPDTSARRDQPRAPASRARGRAPGYRARASQRFADGVEQRLLDGPIGRGDRLILVVPEDALAPEDRALDRDRGA